MRKSIILIVAAALGSSVLIASADFSSAVARPRVTLGQCIGNYNGCRLGCTYGVVMPPPWGGLSDLEYKQCQNACDANHAACVDLAFSRASAK